MDNNVRRMLICGIRYSDFEEKYTALPSKEQKQLHKVALRMWMALVLRYHTTIQIQDMSPQEKASIMLFEWPSLEVYLLFTCIDTLASSGFRRFPDWLKKQKVGCDISLTLTEIRELYEKYENECGVSSNLRKLFNKLQPSVVKWLTQSMSIRAGDGVKEVENQEEMIQLMYIHFFKTCRNPFTHQASSYQPYVVEYIHLPEAEKILMSRFHQFKSEGKKYGIFFHQGIDEATILRMIIRAVVLQKLEIEVTAELIAEYIENLSRQSALYCLIREIKANSAALKWWEEFKGEGSGEFYTYLANAGVPLLSFYWSSLVIRQLIFHTELPLESGLYKLTLEYLDAVNKLNAEINGLNEANSPTSGNWPERLSNIDAFMRSQSERDPFRFIAEMPFRSEIDLLKIVARDPCYS